MAIVRPKMADGETTSFTGILPVGLWDFKDRSGDYDWADVFLSVELKVEGSEYTRFLELCGRLEKSPSGEVTGGFVLKRLYHFFDLIGFTGGLNLKGEWEDSDGVAITNIAGHLNERFQTGNPIMDTSFDYLAYIYKEEPKQKGGKSYTKVHHRLFKNTTTGMAKMTEHVSWMKGKNFIKEWAGPSLNGATTQQPVMSEPL